MIINYSDEKIITGKKSIFLAGPTPRSIGILSWRKEACKILQELNFDGIVYVPEYSDLKPRKDYLDQVEWERSAFTEATVISFWVPRTLPNMPGFTTNTEFGYWIHSGKIIYGRPKYAEKVRYLDWLYQKECQKEPYSILKDLLKASVALVETMS